MNTNYDKLAEEAMEVKKSLENIQKTPSEAQKKAIKMKSDAIAEKEKKMEASAKVASGVSTIIKMGSTWTCKCGKSTTGNFCLSCGSKSPQKELIDTAAVKKINPVAKNQQLENSKMLRNKMMESNPQKSAGNQWQCSCGTTNKGNFCAGCGGIRQ